MNTAWRQFLAHQRAHLAHEHSPQTGFSVTSGVLCDLSSQGLLAASGSDARAFLQGQLSADLNALTPSTSLLAAYCSPKGRALSTFQLFEREESIYLALSADLIEPMLKRLKMFVMRSAVSLTNVSHSLVHFAYIDPQGVDRLQTLLNVTLPTESNQVLTLPDITLIRRTASVPRFEIYGQLEACCRLWEQLSSNAHVLDSAVWDYFEIAAGIPHVTLASSEAWVPQMLNLHLLNGVSFSKGCYPGQEIVARLKYLGKNKRQLYRLRLVSDALPAVGSTLCSESDSDAGQVLNAAFNPKGEVEILAVMKIAATQEPLSLAGLPVLLLDLPYSIETE